MLVYAVFAVALTAANLGSEPPAVSVSPGAYPSGLTIDKVFFTPAIVQPRRNDM